MRGGTKRADELDGSEPREQALPFLVEAHGGRLFALGLRFCGNREDAEDLVQESFLQAYRKWDQFAGRARASTWLYTIAARTCQQEALDRGADFEFPGRVVCERCAEFFATLDLTQELCADIARGALPAPLRRALLAEMRAP